MDALDPVLIAVHVVAVVLWIGAFAAIGVVATGEGDVKVRGALARRIYTKVAVPAFLGAVAFGLFRLLRGWSGTSVDANGIVAGGYAKAPWMHVKLTLALIIVALHHVIGGRTRKMATNGAPPGPIGVLSIVLVVAAAGAVGMVILRPFHH